MAEVHEWIQAARRAGNLDSSEFVELPRDEARDVIHRARTIYVAGNPRAWWESLKPPTTVVRDPPHDWHYQLATLVDTKDRTCLFVPELDEEELRVYRVQIDKIGAIIKDCPFFEYYIMALDLSWLVAENDHNEVVLSRGYP